MVNFAEDFDNSIQKNALRAGRLTQPRVFFYLTVDLVLKITNIKLESGEHNLYNLINIIRKKL